MGIWEVYESKHYIFNYEKNSYAKKYINEIAVTQEKCYLEIIKTLNIKFQIKIEYFLCDTPEIVGSLYGDNEPCNGLAVQPNKIYAVYNEEIKCMGSHEDAHIISYSIGHPNSTAIREGFAMYFDKAWWNISNYDCCKLYLENGSYCEVSELVDNNIFYKIPCEISYPIMGAFTGYLIKKFGINKYIEFYKTTKEICDLEIERVFGMSFTKLETNFKTFINILPYKTSKDIIIKTLIK